MRIVTACTIVALVTLVAAPAIAQDRDAARAACNTYAEIKTEGPASASPRLGPSPRPAPPALSTPPSGGIQAPAAGDTKREIQAPGTSAGAAAGGDLAGKSEEFQQAFRDCMRKLAS